MSTYRDRIWQVMDELLRPLGALDHVLDFGSGDGWFAERVIESGTCNRLVAVDVTRRKHELKPPLIIRPGEPLPFADSTFDCSYAIDVLHHCGDPIASLDELTRVTAGYLLIKDHTYRSLLGRWSLAILDELGNRRFGIPSPRRYQRDCEWDDHLSRLGWQRIRVVHPAPCHTGLLGRATNSLQYVALYRRRSPLSDS